MQEISDNIDRVYQELQALSKYLQGSEDAPYLMTFKQHDNKILLLSVASYFERKITANIKAYVEQSAGGNRLIVSLIEKRVLERKYHTFFRWDEKTKNINEFLSMFGEDFKNEIAARIIATKVNDRETQKDYMLEFLKLGRLRNELVHEDFVTNRVGENTTEDIYKSFEKADKFIDFIFENLFDHRLDID